MSKMVLQKSSVLLQVVADAGDLTILVNVRGKAAAWETDLSGTASYFSEPFQVLSREQI